MNTILEQITSRMMTLFNIFDLATTLTKNHSDKPGEKVDEMQGRTRQSFRYQKVHGKARCDEQDYDTQEIQDQTPLHLSTPWHLELIYITYYEINLFLLPHILILLHFLFFFAHHVVVDIGDFFVVDVAFVYDSLELYVVGM